MVSHLVKRGPQADVAAIQRPVVGEAVHVGQQDQHPAGAGPGGSGHRQLVAAERPARQVAHHRGGGHRRQHRGQQLGQPFEHGCHRVAVRDLRRVGVGVPHGRGQRAAEARQQRLVVVDRAVRPLRAVEHLHLQRRPACHCQPACAGHVQLGDPHQFGDRPAVHGVDVGLGAALVGYGACDPAGVLGVVAADALQRLEEALQERDPAERVVVAWRTVAHGGIVEG